MANTNINSKNIITKESIFGALMILMEKKEFKEISITEITEKAGVSRMAFYRNYNQKEDIITIYLNDFFDKSLKELLNKKQTDVYHNTLFYLSKFRAEKQLMTNLIKSDMTNLILEICRRHLYSLSKNIVCEKSYSPEIEKYIVEFVAGGFTNTLIEWAKGGMKERDEYMADTIFNYCVVR